MRRIHPFAYQAGQMVPGTELRIVRPIGYGGGGAVYEVWHRHFENTYVMKVLHPKSVGAGYRGIVREATIHARMVHPNIVRILWADWTKEEPRFFFLVMEKLSGYPLRKVLRRYAETGKTLPLELVFNVSTNLLRALSYAHDNRVIHRDVKPENIFIHQEGDRWVTKLLDFGVGATLSARKTIETAFRGTYEYAAPEQLAGTKLTPACDIYACGLVLYEMLAGRGPFEGTTLTVARAHMELQPPPISRWRAVNPELEAIALQMLAKQPSERGDPAAIARAIEKVRLTTKPDPDEPALLEVLSAGERAVSNAGDTPTDPDGDDLQGTDPTGAALSISSSGEGQRSSDEATSRLSDIHLLGIPGDGDSSSFSDDEPAGSELELSTDRTHAVGYDAITPTGEASVPPDQLLPTTEPQARSALVRSLIPHEVVQVIREIEMEETRYVDPPSEQGPVVPVAPNPRPHPEAPAVTSMKTVVPCGVLPQVIVNLTAPVASTGEPQVMSSDFRESVLRGGPRTVSRFAYLGVAAVALLLTGTMVRRHATTPAGVASPLQNPPSVPAFAPTSREPPQTVSAVEGAVPLAKPSETRGLPEPAASPSVPRRSAVRSPEPHPRAPVSRATSTPLGASSRTRARPSVTPPRSWLRTEDSKVRPEHLRDAPNGPSTAPSVGSSSPLEFIVKPL